MAKKRRTKAPNRAVIPAPAAIVRGNVNREVTVSPSFVSLYANDVQLQTSPWDIRLTFGEMMVNSDGDDVTARVKQTGEVRLSPPLAKRVALLLVRQLKAYEERFGPIPQPKEDD